MAKFHFENDHKDLGETRRIDDITRQVQKLDKDNEATGGENTDSSDKFRRKTDGKIFSVSVKAAVVLVIFALLFIVGIGFLLYSILSEQRQPGAASSNQSSSSQYEAIGEKQIKYALITAAGENSLELYSFDESKIFKADFSQSVIITGTTGGQLSKANLKYGMLVSADISSEGKIVSVRWPQDAWHIDSTTGVKTDANAKTISAGNESYSYDEQSLFAYNGDSFDPSELNVHDTVTLYGVNKKLYSAIIEHRHGNVVLKNAENITDLAVFVDLVHVDDINGNSVPVSFGKHNVVVSGSNIPDFLSSIDVTDNASIEVDLSSGADNKRIHITSNVKGYVITVNGNSYAPDTSEIGVKTGTYSVTVSAPGYKSADYTADCTTGDAEINAVLEKNGSSSQPGTSSNPPVPPDQTLTGNVTINSSPGWARIYADGKYIGVSPVLISLSYGEHTITAQLDGRDNINQDIIVNSPDKIVSMNFDK